MRKLLTLLSVMVGLYANSQVICGGKCTTLTAGNPQNLSNPQYTLNPGNVPPISGTNQWQVCPNVTTTYTLLTVGTNTNNAQQTTSAVVTVTVNPQPVISPTLTQASCTSTVIGLNLGLSFLPASPVPGYTITWYSLPTPTMGSTSYSAPSGVQPGTYAFTIVAAGGCQIIDSVKLNPPPAPANFSLFPYTPTMSLTCLTTSFDIVSTDASLNYTWSSNSTSPIAGQYSLNIASPGCWTVVGENPGTFCTKTYTFCIVTNTVPPGSTITPQSQLISCTNIATSTFSAYANPTVNIMHQIYDKCGGTATGNGSVMIYPPGCGPGTYTHVLTDLVNGCTTTKLFTVTSNEGFPTFNLQSPSSYTLGCSTKSIATVNFVNASASTPGGGVTYTVMGPGGTLTPGPGLLSTLSTWTFNTAGSYTAYVREIQNSCQTTAQFNIITNDFPPDIFMGNSPGQFEPLPILDCTTTFTVLQGGSMTNNVNYQWSFQGNPGTVNSNTVRATINTGNPTNTIVNTYTLTVTDNSSLCKSTYSVPVRQNLFPPKPLFSLGTTSITCATPTAVLTNISQTGIPPTFPVPPILAVVGATWQGPTPQDPKYNSTTYEAYTVGVYTLTAKDLNNGCTASYTATVQDFRDYPVFALTYTPINCGSNGNGALKEAVTNLQGGAPAYTWTAINPAGSFSMSGRFTPTMTVNRSGIYELLVLNQKNGCITTHTIAIPNSTLIADFSADKLKGYVPLTVTFNNNSRTFILENGETKENNQGITQIWSLGNGTFVTGVGTSSLNAPITRVYTQPGTYSVALHAVKGQCMDDTVQYVVVDIPSKLKIPNIFSPNNDKVNDFWFLETSNLTEITCTITDRWGHKVYDLTSATGNILWDGKNQAGVEVAEGVYYYVISAKGADGAEFNEKGTITLVR